MSIDVSNLLSVAQRSASSNTRTGEASSQPVDTAPASAEPAKPVHADHEIEQAVRKIEAHMLGMDRTLEFSVDRPTGTTVVTVRERGSGTVIRQIPSEEALWLAENLDKISGKLLNTKA